MAEEEKRDQPSHAQVYSILTGKDPSWQSIIYDLINSEQLDPWNIDIVRLCQGYFERVKELEESNFFISSKILLAASLLLRIKSEILLNKYLTDIDSILFGKKEGEKQHIIERIEIDENEIPVLVPKSPLPRFKQVTLEELMGALDKAMKTESRRIDKEIEKKQAERLAYIDIPKFKRINIRDRIRQFYAKILSSFKNQKNKRDIKLPYSHFTGDNKEEKIACFLPMLHLSNNEKIWLEQNNHFEEIYLYLYHAFKEKFPEHDAEIKEIEQELEAEILEIGESESDKQKKAEKINEDFGDFDNPISDLIGESKEEN